MRNQLSLISLRSNANYAALAQRIEMAFTFKQYGSSSSYNHKLLDYCAHSLGILAYWPY